MKKFSKTQSKPIASKQRSGSATRKSPTNSTKHSSHSRSNNIEERRSSTHHRDDRPFNDNSSRFNHRPHKDSAHRRDDRPFNDNSSRFNHRPHKDSAHHRDDRPFNDNSSRFNHRPHKDSAHHRDDRPFNDNSSRFNHRPHKDSAHHRDDRPFNDNSSRFNHRPHKDSAHHRDDRPFNDNSSRFNHRPHKDSAHHRDDRPFNDNSSRFNHRPHKDSAHRRDDRPFNDNSSRFNHRPHKDSAHHRDDRPFNDNSSRFNHRPHKDSAHHRDDRHSSNNKSDRSTERNGHNHKNKKSFGKKDEEYRENHSNKSSSQKILSIESVLIYIKTLSDNVLNVDSLLSQLDVYSEKNKSIMYSKIEKLIDFGVLSPIDDINLSINNTETSGFAIIKIIKVLDQNKYEATIRLINSTNIYTNTITIDENISDKIQDKYILGYITDTKNTDNTTVVIVTYLDNNPKLISNNTQTNKKLDDDQIAVVKQQNDGTFIAIPLNFRSKDTLILSNFPEELKEHSIIQIQVISKLKAEFIKLIKEEKTSTSCSMLSVYQYHIPYEFSEEVIQEAQIATACSLENRFDARNIPLVTIDDEDAKDFDDAIFAEKIDDNSGAYKIYVAIADVSYYVKMNSNLDNEAIIRGNSVYLPGFVIPMLPENLSNGWCSLKPNEERGCLLAQIVVNRNGELEEFSFSRALMTSKARLTYNQVQSAIDGNTDAITAPLMDSVITPIYEAYKLLQNARNKRSTLEINSLETKIVLDSEDNILDIIIKKQLTSHKIVEEFMIAANVASAKFISNNIENKQQSIYRTHPKPNLEKLQDFKSVLKSFNIYDKVPTNPEEINAGFFNSILHKYRSEYFLTSLNESVLRAQSPATYNNNNIGHFGLGLKLYTHFTSPIRRYSDLIVHRVLLSILEKKELPYSADNLNKTCQSISLTERRAFQAENSAKDKILAKWFEDKIGETFEGYISTITQSGMFINLFSNNASGLLPTRLISNSYVTVDTERNMIKEKGGKTYKLGDKIAVKVYQADYIQGMLTFTLK